MMTRFLASFLMSLVLAMPAFSQSNKTLLDRLETMQENYDALLDGLVEKLEDMMACNRIGLLYDDGRCMKATEVEPQTADFARTEIGLPSCIASGTRANGDMYTELLKSTGSHEISCVDASTYIDASENGCPVTVRHISGFEKSCTVSLPLLGKGSTNRAVCYDTEGARTYELKGTFKCGDDQIWSSSPENVEVVQSAFASCRASHSVKLPDSSSCIADYERHLAHNQTKSSSCVSSDGIIYAFDLNCKDNGSGEPVLTVLNLEENPDCRAETDGKRLSDSVTRTRSCVAQPLGAANGGESQIADCISPDGYTLMQSFVCDGSTRAFVVDPDLPDTIVTPGDACDGSDYVTLMDKRNGLSCRRSVEGVVNGGLVNGGTEAISCGQVNSPSQAVCEGIIQCVNGHYEVVEADCMLEETEVEICSARAFLNAGGKRCFVDINEENRDIGSILSHMYCDVDGGRLESEQMRCVHTPEQGAYWLSEQTSFVPVGDDDDDSAAEGVWEIFHLESGNDGNCSWLGTACQVGDTPRICCGSRGVPDENGLSCIATNRRNVYTIDPMYAECVEKETP